MDITTFNIRLTPTDGENACELGPYLSDIRSANELSYQSSPTRTNDMTLHNDQEAFYVPTVEITFAYLSEDRYAKFMQVVNSKGMMVYYYDLELAEYVWRAMYVSEKSISQLHALGGNIENIIGAKVTFVSRWGYPYTPSGNPYCTKANKYHMARLHANKDITSVPGTEEYPDYV